MEQQREPVRIPSVLLEMSAERLRTVIINFHTMTHDEVRQSLIVTHRELYETLLFYTNESRENIPHL
jgi:hypothetical protein